MTVTVNDLVLIASTLGGAELIRYLITWYRERKKDKKALEKEEIDLNNSEFGNYKTQIEFLNEQLTMLNQRLVEKSNEFIELDKKYKELSDKLYELQMKLMESQLQLNKANSNICYNKSCQTRNNER